jgi:hypothetical protein
LVSREVSPDEFTYVYELPEGAQFHAEVVGKLHLPRKVKKLVKYCWEQRVKLGTHLFNGTIYAVKPQFNWAQAKFKFDLYKTSYAHCLARWIKSGTTRVKGFKYVTVPALMMVQDEEGNYYFVLGLTNSNTAFGAVVNFIGGTLDERHASSPNPLQANMWAECWEEMEISTEDVAEWWYAYLAETEGSYHLVAMLLLKLSLTGVQDHFQTFTIRDKEKEITKIITILATKDGVVDALSKYQFAGPVEAVLSVAVGLDPPDTP